MNEEKEDDEDDDEEFVMTFEPDEALILALNSINDLKELVEEQSSSIELLKKDLLQLKEKSKL